MSAFAGGLGRFAARLLLDQITESQKQELAGTRTNDRGTSTVSGNTAFGDPFLSEFLSGIDPFITSPPVSPPTPPPIASSIPEPSAVDIRPSEQFNPLANAIASRMKSPITSTTEGISTARPTVGTPF